MGNQAHAHVQIFGWVALFIMGVTYHVLPRLKAAALQHVALGYASYWLMAGGVLLHAVYRAFMANPALAPIAVLSALMELAGILAFAVVVVTTMRKGTAPADLSDKYLVAGVLGFVVMGVMNAVMLSIMAVARHRRAAGGVELGVPAPAAHCLRRHVHLRRQPAHAARLPGQAGAERRGWTAWSSR